MALARELVAPYRDTPYRIGYFSDNEVGWWAGALFIFYSSKPATSITKQRWVALLRRHYAGDWSRFTADFLPPAGGRFVGSAPRRDRIDADEARRGRDTCRARMDRHGRRALLHARRERRSARPIPTRCFSATGCRSTTTRRRCGRWRRMSTRSPPTTTSTAATAGSRIISSTGCENCRAASRCSFPSGFSRRARTARETATTAI